ncbi:hypothetical protein pdam_00012198 [Pocillopora damicornis]|uniref:Uncharacterized protein n=1 Tax=Pocillopora damicornis TaxID=46731 RepID=A0A3M6UE97_POCDA|nr:hypothetical protein pdam_00012198 [Pocillopora damicornis]
MKCSRRPWYSKKKSESHRAMEKPGNLQTSNCSRLQQGYKIPHNGKGKRKRDMLLFKQELVRTTPTRNKATKRQRQNMPPEDCLANVGPHLPIKGEENSH